MKRKLPILIMFVVVTMVALTACGAPAAPAASSAQVAAVPTAQTIEVTRIVEVTPEGGAQVKEVPAQVVAGGDTLTTVQKRGKLKCSQSTTLPGFAFLEADGTISGFEVDICRAIAAATIGDAKAIELRQTNGEDRFPVLQTGEVDVGFNTTTWTISRDTSLGFNFATVYFYDGQGIMVKKDSKISSLKDLDGGTVCAQSGTTSEKNITDAARNLGIKIDLLVFTEMNQIRETFLSGRCDAYTTDQSELIGYHAIMKDPQNYTILPDIISKEPLTTYTRQGDENWTDIVDWSVYCMIQAEELGVTSKNVEDMKGSDNPSILSLLGVEGELGKAMGLKNDWCAQIVKQVGNYGEIFDQNLGPNTPLGLQRGLNDLWNKGGLLYSPPFR